MGLVPLKLQDAHLNRARACIRQAMTRYSTALRWSKHSSTDLQRQAAIKADLDQLSALLNKLDYALVRVAVFGLVSRGKSAVLNALLEQKVLQTGPLHGVTQWPRSVYWSPELPDQPAQLPIQVELIDTPGLDEIEGQERAKMARDVAQQADLILFVIAGDITRTEYRALKELQQAQKPILLVFNKIDLYPDQDRQAIYEKLKMFGRQAVEENGPIASPSDIVLVAAEPAPLEVRVEWPDGRVTHEWETPVPQIDELKHKLIEIVQREGRSLLALNALRQSREIESTVAQKITELQQAEAEALIWKFAKYKAIAIALNPIAVLDLLGGAIADLMMIRALARLYGLPMTGYEAGKLWKTILQSSGGVLLSEWGSGLILGAGKTAAAAAAVFESPASLTLWAGAMTLQAAAAGYGTYIVGQAAQTYLEQGCTWGPQGANTVIQDILSQVESSSILERLRQDVEAT